MKLYWYKGSTQLVRVRGLYDKVTEQWLNAATVQITVKEKDGNSRVPGAEVTGETWPLALGYVAASDGIYEGTAAAAVNVNLGEDYWAEIVATQGGVTRLWILEFEATAKVET